MKGLLWGLIGGIIGFALQELMGMALNTDSILGWMGYPGMEEIYTNAYAGIYTESQIYTLLAALQNAIRINSAFFSAFMACGIGLFWGWAKGLLWLWPPGAEKCSHRRGHFTGARVPERLYRPVAL